METRGQVIKDDHKWKGQDHFVEYNKFDQKLSMAYTLSKVSKEEIRLLAKQYYLWILKRSLC
jgi:hypothetical protein